MRKRWNNLRWWILLVGLGLLLVPFVAYGATANRGMGGNINAKETKADKGPDFTLKDLQGRKFNLSENRGKPVLLVFGATWCPSCREEIPHFKDIYNNYGKKGVVMVNIDIQEPRDKVSRFADRYKLPYPVLLDETTAVARSYGIRGVPTMVLIDREGLIACWQCSSVEPLLDKMLKKN